MEWFITNRKLTKSEEDYLDIIENLSKRVNYIIFREKDLLDREYEALYLKVKEKINSKCTLIINSNIYVYKKYNEEILHLSFEKFLKYKKYFNERVGVSIHSVEEGKVADRLGADYILASNIYETKCKIGKKGKGIKFIKELKENIKCPIIALGGIDDKNKEEVLNSGAIGIATMSYYIEQFYKIK